MSQQPIPASRLPSRPRAIALAIHLMLAGVALTALLPAAAIAAEPAAAAKKSYAIGAGALGDVLAQFAASAGVRLSFDPALVAGQRSAGLQGSFAVNEGFARILAGSGYELVGIGDGAYSLRKLPQPATTGKEATLAPVTVIAGADLPGSLSKAYAGGQIARGGRLGLLGNVDEMDSPFHLTSYTAQAIADQQASTVAEMVGKDPSVRSTAQNGDVADAFFIRGFAVGDNNIGEIAFDGLYGVAPNYRLMTDYAERIEVLKGPAAMIYGMSPNSGVGGSINVVPKRADADLTQLRADYSTESQAGGHLDFSRRFGAEREFGMRFNGTYQNGDTPIGHQSRQTGLGALALDYRGERLRATLDLIDQHEKVDAPSRRPWLSAGLAVPKAADNRNNITQRWEWYESTERSALLRAEFDIHSQWSVFVSYGLATSDIDRLFNTPVIVNAAGDTRVTPTRAVFDVERSASEAGLRGRFATGQVNHQVTLQWSQYDDRLGLGTVAGQAYGSNLYQPVEQPAQEVATPASVPKRSTNRLSGAALSDTLTMFDERLHVLLGLRQQNISSDNFGANEVLTSRYEKSAVTPMLGVVVKPLEYISLYGNYIEGLSKGDTAPNTAANAGEIFAPYEARQQEVGIKVDHGRLMTQLSAFQITRPSGFLTGNRFSVDGEQRNRGIELSVHGALGDRLRLYGGVTWIEATLTKTNSPATAGNTAVGVPEIQVALNAEWDIPLVAGLTLTGGLFHSGKQYANQANTQRLPAWTTLDLGARYRTLLAGKTVTLRAGLSNASDKDYWAGASTWGTLIAGAPRSLRLSTTVDF